MSTNPPSHADKGSGDASSARSWTVLPGYAEERLDRFVCIMEDTSRSHAQELIESGRVRVGGRVAKAGQRLTPGELVTLDWASQAELRGQDLASAEALRCLYQDEAIVVLDKAAGLVVHPGGSHHAGTVAQLADERFGPLPRGGGEDRPGIVHRLDKETSGVLVLARSEEALAELQRQFRERETQKEYFAIVHGAPRFASEWIDAALDRDAKHPERMRAVREGGREAQTYYELEERYDGFAALRCFPKTGRTHQIRVHMALRKMPIVGDVLYPLRQRNQLGLPSGAPDPGRHALHARALTIAHPVSGREMRFEAELPGDLRALRDWLRAERAPGDAPRPGRRRR